MKKETVGAVTHTHTHTQVSNNKKEIDRRNDNGVTLIALVITIIILLILASISITTLFGQDGILTKADKAKGDTETAQTNEQKDINALLDMFSKVQVADGGTLTLSTEDLKTLVDSMVEEKMGTMRVSGKLKTVSLVASVEKIVPIDMDSLVGNVEMVDETSNSIIIPQDGYYLITSSRNRANKASDWTFNTISVNGTGILSTHIRSATAIVSNSGCLFLRVGDVITFNYNSGTAVSTIDFPDFSVVYVGQ